MTDHHTEMQARAATASELITAASKILQGFFGKRDLRISMKDGNDPVTEADFAVDKLVREQLREIFPNDAILTEETSDGNFDAYRDHPAVWIVDPLDGTKNFSRGIPNYACGIGFASKGQPVLGAIAFADGTRIVTQPAGNVREIRSVSDTRDLSRAMVSMDFPKKAEDRVLGAKIAGKLLNVGVSGFRSMGSAVADFARVADGQLDAYIHPGLSPWDAAAPAAFVLAAGGRITRLDGSPWNVFCPDVLASNRQLHSRLLSAVNREDGGYIVYNGPSEEELKKSQESYCFTLPGLDYQRDQGLTANGLKMEPTDESGIYRITFSSAIDMADAADGMAFMSSPRPFDILYDPLAREGYMLPKPSQTNG
ncbi:inositol monophosphatase [Candidatus Uhrbacteria bacterium]|nr:inositol monophosphatase [Candidatus Uhrbacteria bacterium]